MKNKIGKYIKTNVYWSREITRMKKGKRSLGKITGLYIRDKEQKSATNPLGFCGSIKLRDNGSLEIWTNGKYQFIEAKIVEKLICELLARIS